MEEIEKLRGEVDAIDEKIVKLLKRRFKIVKEIGEHKNKSGVNIEDIAREKEVLRNYLKSSAGLDKEFMRELANLILKYSKKIQKR